ncbi:MAG: hypothetical protein M3R30_04275 [Candidatus Eremiobacteraeota bacterium]|nr:hypothetical protein [Candidatus Eremiobacteraeota bacterium]
MATYAHDGHRTARLVDVADVILAPHGITVNNIAPGAIDTLFVLNGAGPGKDLDPPAAYYVLELRNDSTHDVQMGSYAFCQLRGQMPYDVVVRYDTRLHAFVARNSGKNSDHVRMFGASTAPTSYEVTSDHAKSISERCSGTLSGSTDDSWDDPLGAFHHSHALAPGETARLWYTLSFSVDGRRAAEKAYPLSSSSPTGWSFVNDPTRSNNSVGRDTAWFAFGADYVTPDFARESLLAYVSRQEPSGMIVEYYDVRNGKTADYGLNVNDNTPLLVLALWHHYNTTGDTAFLEQVYPAAVRAGLFFVSQRNDQGLVWWTSAKTQDWGIVGWRNAIENYRLSGATTELNSECYAALATVGHMARVLEKHDESAEFAQHATDLRDAINAHLLNRDNGLYYFNIDIDGRPRTDITSDLVFPVMFGVATDETAARIISRLSTEDFWTEAGIRTVPRDAPQQQS